MMAVDEIRRILEDTFPGAHVSVLDMTGGQDHFQVEVVSDAFKGKMLIEQHRMVQSPLQPYINDERIHALTIRTSTPDKWKKPNDLINLE